MFEKVALRRADSLEWDQMLNLVSKLYQEKNYRISLLIALSCHLGIRISDILALRWIDIVNTSTFTLVEEQTSKNKEIHITSDIQKLIMACHQSLKIVDLNEFCFLSQKHSVYSVQRINVILKELNRKYNLGIENFSTHTLRKTFGLRIYSNARDQKEDVLMALSVYYNHSSVKVTKDYLGILEPKKHIDIFKLL